MEVFVTVEGMEQLDPGDIRVGAAYELTRGEERHRVAALKHPRRIHLGATLALVFENRDTIRSTLEEALRSERIDDPDRVAGEIAAFNAVLPDPGQLAAVLFLEVADPADIAATAANLEGVEHSVYLEVAAGRVRGVPEAVSLPGDSVAAHYLRFGLEPEQREAIRSRSAIAVGTEHPHLMVRVQLDEDQRAAVAADLSGDR
jgi:hypothetical protein